MNNQAVWNEISQEQYAGMTDAEIVAALNAVGAASRQRISVAALQARAYEIGASMALRTAIATPDTPAQLRALCDEVLSLVNSRLDSIDIDNPTARQMFAALGQYRVLTPEQLAAIDALATVPGTSRAHDIGLGVVDEADVAAARDWHAAQLAEQARIAAFAALRERLVSGQQEALAWLRTEQDAGNAAPEWAAVLERL